MRWPRVVSESLRRIDHPAEALHGHAATLADVVAAHERAQRPDRCAESPPAFLLPHQRDSWRRIVAALRGWRGALLAEPLGTGKTWIALAVCARESSRGAVVVPAVLRAQWQRAAGQAGVNITITTHEGASRGAVPPGNPGLVIIDEAHRFRNMSTRRVRTLAPWLVGRRVLLVSATPIVNRLRDLVAMLQLVLPDDALALDGVASLTGLLHHTTPPVALRRVVIRSPTPHAATWSSRRIELRSDADEERRGAGAVARIGALALSTAPQTQRLIRSVLLDAAASSDAALVAALRRYRGLLLHARDCGSASRSMLRRFAGTALDQVVMWPLLELEPGVGDLPLDDLARVDLMILRHEPDDAGWTRRMQAACTDETITVCYTRHRATALILRRAFGDGTAWVTGSAAGIGPHRAARSHVLEAFGPARATWQLRRIAPRVLIATDVAAEGLDLQAAGRIVHVDLPWTATRVDQREGRLLRIGQQHAHVEVVTRAVPTAVESALALHAGVRRKRGLAHRWLDALGMPDPVGSGTASGPLVATLTGIGRNAAIVAVALRSGSRRGVITMVRGDDGGWTAIDDALASLPICTSAAPTEPVGPVSSTLAAAARGALAHIGRTAWCPPATLVARLHRLARDAARRRDRSSLAHLDRLLRLVHAAPTAGTRLLLAQITAASDRDVCRQWAPDVPPPEPIEAHAIAAVVPARAATTPTVFPSLAGGLR